MRRAKTKGWHRVGASLSSRNRTKELQGAAFPALALGLAKGAACRPAPAPPAAAGEHRAGPASVPDTFPTPDLTLAAVP